MYKVLCLHTVKQEIICAGGLSSLFYLSFQPRVYILFKKYAVCINWLCK
jgi:hypothetical protein